MMRRAVPALVSVLLCVAALTACGDDEGESIDGSVRDAGSESRDGGGSGTAGKRSSAAGTGGRGAAPRAGEGGKSGDSAGTTGEKAGAGGTGGRRAADGGSAGEASETTPANGRGCPKLSFPGLFTLPACCTSRSMCGVDTSMFGGPGCLDLATAAERARMSGATVIFPAPRACGPDDTEADAGTPDDAGAD